jgi:hypothetical protein
MYTVSKAVPDNEAILKELRERMGSIEVITTQLSESAYSSVEVYANNMNILADFYQGFGEHLQDPVFVRYLKQNDTDLFINILSIGRAISLMKNLLLNISQLLKNTGSSD